MANARYRHISLNQAQRKTLNVSRFGGLDLTSQKFNVSSGHAIDGENFVYKDNVIQVRQGFEELYRVSPFLFIAKDFVTGAKVESVVTENPVNFNGMWQFDAEDGERHYIVHVGYLLYEIKNFGTKDMKFEVLANDLNNETGDYKGSTISARLLYKFLNERTNAFVGDKKLWFLGGNQYMVIRFLEGKNKISPVEDSDLVFIPKTTMNITYTNSQVTYRASLDYPNMLTMFRRNSLVTGTGKSENVLTEVPYYEYTLDAPLLTKDDSFSLGAPSLKARQAFSKINLIIKSKADI